MAYRFSRKDDSVQDAVRRLTRQQIHDVLRRIDDPSCDRETTVHEVRKACKKLRAVLRLVEPGFPGAAKENTALRDIARGVSVVRDAATLVGSFDAVVAAYGAQLDHDAQEAMRNRLVLQRDALLAATDIDALLADCRTALLALEWRSCEWTLEGDDCGMLREGLRRWYRKARHALFAAHASPTPERLHAWRKRAKDHLYHARLFAPTWEKPMRAHVRAAHALGELLGQHHDLTVLLDTLAREPGAVGTNADAEVLAGLAGSLQAVLQAQAFSAGAALFADKPKALADSWIARYAAWRDEVPAHVAAMRQVAEGARHASVRPA